jgi:hypothetical protein
MQLRAALSVLEAGGQAGRQARLEACSWQEWSGLIRPLCVSMKDGLAGDADGSAARLKAPNQDGPSMGAALFSPSPGADLARQASQSRALSSPFSGAPPQYYNWRDALLHTARAAPWIFGRNGI